MSDWKKRRAEYCAVYREERNSMDEELAAVKGWNMGRTDVLSNLHELTTDELLKDERVKRLVDAAKLGLSFAPKVEPPPGLDPTFYHTLNYEDECALMGRLTDAREALAEWES